MLHDGGADFRDDEAGGGGPITTLAHQPIAAH